MKEKISRIAPPIVICAALLIPSNWWRVELLFSPIDSQTLNKEDVILYSTSWCQFCTKTRQFLRSAGVSFIEWDIEKSPQAYQQYLQISGRGVPVVQIGTNVVEGYNQHAIRKAINTLVQSRQSL